LQAYAPDFNILPDFVFLDVGKQKDLGESATRTTFFFKGEEKLGDVDY